LIQQDLQRVEDQGYWNPEMLIGDKVRAAESRRLRRSKWSGREAREREGVGGVGRENRGCEIRGGGAKPNFFFFFFLFTVVHVSVRLADHY
jgi:hypothetical protein